MKNQHFGTQELQVFGPVTKSQAAFCILEATSKKLPGAKTPQLAAPRPRLRLV